MGPYSPVNQETGSSQRACHSFTAVAARLPSKAHLQGWAAQAARPGLFGHNTPKSIKTLLGGFLPTWQTGVFAGVGWGPCGKEEKLRNR